MPVSSLRKKWSEVWADQPFPNQEQMRSIMDEIVNGGGMVKIESGRGRREGDAGGGTGEWRGWRREGSSDRNSQVVQNIVTDERVKMRKRDRKRERRQREATEKRVEEGEGEEGYRENEKEEEEKIEDIAGMPEMTVDERQKVVDPPDPPLQHKRGGKVRLLDFLLEVASDCCRIEMLGQVYTIHTIHTIYTIHTIHTIYTIHNIHTIHTIHTIHAIAFPWLSHRTP